MENKLKEQITSLSLEQLQSILTEDGFTIFGHGTGGNNTEVIDLIFKNGLRASHTSIFYTSIGLDVDEELKIFKNKLDNWQHLNSENIILMKLPNKYFNIYGDSMDLGCEKTGAFVNQKIDEKGNITYYLDPKFILGAYNRISGKVRINPKFEFQLTEKTIQELDEKLFKVQEKVRIKNEGLSANNLPSIDQTRQVQKFEYDNLEFIDNSFNDYCWDNDFPNLEETKGRTK